jgi:hypothetical protein
MSSRSVLTLALMKRLTPLLGQPLKSMSDETCMAGQNQRVRPVTHWRHQIYIRVLRLQSEPPSGIYVRRSRVN